MLKHVNDKNVENEIKSGKIVVLDVYADWCGPCKMIAPVMDELSKNDKIKVLKLNSDENKESVAKHKVSSLPTILFFKDGIEKDRHIGFASLDHLMTIINKI